MRNRRFVERLLSCFLGLQLRVMIAIDVRMAIDIDDSLTNYE